MPPEYMIAAQTRGLQPRYTAGQVVRKFIQGTTLTPVGTVFTIRRVNSTAFRHYYVGENAEGGVWEEELELVGGEVGTTNTPIPTTTPRPEDRLFANGQRVRKEYHGVRDSGMGMGEEFVIDHARRFSHGQWAYYGGRSQGAWEDELLPLPPKRERSA
jgi:hypothetical protein